MSKYKYILDNGHGLNTVKKESKVWKDGTQLKEYLFNRDIVKLLSFMLKDDNIDFEILVPELKDISLSERVKRANNLGKNRESILISVHGNQFTDPKVFGIETHYYKAGKEIAEIFQDKLKVLSKNRGIKQSDFYIIKHTSMPAILTENGFYSNRDECREMLSKDFQYEIALQHYKAIKEIESC